MKESEEGRERGEESKREWVVALAEVSARMSGRMIWGFIHKFANKFSHRQQVRIASSSIAPLPPSSSFCFSFCTWNIEIYQLDSPWTLVPQFVPISLRSRSFLIMCKHFAMTATWTIYAPQQKPLLICITAFNSLWIFMCNMAEEYSTRWYPAAAL